MALFELDKIFRKRDEIKIILTFRENIISFGEIRTIAEND